MRSANRLLVYEHTYIAVDIYKCGETHSLLPPEKRKGEGLCIDFGGDVPILSCFYGNQIRAPCVV